MSSTPQPTRAGALDELITPVRAATRQICTPEETAELVAGVLRRQLPPTSLLTDDQLAGDPDTYVLHPLHVEPDGTFSVAAVVWRPGQQTPIHDHVAWCVVGVLDGVEEETRYRVVGAEPDAQLERIGVGHNDTGSVCAITPPGDIHSVRNAGDQVAVSLHVYGADIYRLGSSVRRNYDLPVM